MAKIGCSLEEIDTPALLLDLDVMEANIEKMAERFRGIIGEHGSDAVGVFSSAKCTNEENYVFQKFMRAVVGTNNVDHCARL